MEAQQGQRVQKYMHGMNAKALRTVLLCWQMIAEDERLYRPIRESMAAFRKEWH